MNVCVTQEIRCGRQPKQARTLRDVIKSTFREDELQAPQPREEHDLEKEFLRVFFFRCTVIGRGTFQIVFTVTMRSRCVWSHSIYNLPPVAPPPPPSCFLLPVIAYFKTLQDATLIHQLRPRSHKTPYETRQLTNKNVFIHEQLKKKPRKPLNTGRERDVYYDTGTAALLVLYCRPLEKIFYTRLGASSVHPIPGKRKNKYYDQFRASTTFTIVGTLNELRYGFRQIASKVTREVKKLSLE